MTRTEISEFYNKHKKHLYNASLRILGDSMDAEEVMQDTIIKYLKFGRMLEPEQEEAWLVKTCVRASIDVLRKRKTTNAFIEDYKEEMSVGQMEQLDQQLWGGVSSDRNSTLINKIKTKLENLPDGYRTVLSLILFEGYDYEEVSDILGLKESSVRSQYMRGRLRLAEILNK